MYRRLHMSIVFFQICITTSTSAGLEQTLPWLFYHKVIGVSTFFLFVEGKAASPNVSKVLESIPVSWNYVFSPNYIDRGPPVLQSFSCCFPSNFDPWLFHNLLRNLFSGGQGHIQDERIRGTASKKVCIIRTLGKSSVYNSVLMLSFLNIWWYFRFWTWYDAEISWQK